MKDEIARTREQANKRKITAAERRARQECPEWPHGPCDSYRSGGYRDGNGYCDGSGGDDS
jgi:hypothetical protein